MYASSDKRTTPALNMKTVDDEIFYISVSDSNHTLSGLHLGDGTNRYTAYDDNLFYNERP